MVYSKELCFKFEKLKRRNIIWFGRRVCLTEVIFMPRTRHVWLFWKRMETVIRGRMGGRTNVQ